MKSPKFVIIGYPKAGKSTLAEFISDELKTHGLPYGWGDTSAELMSIVAHHHGIDVEEINSNKEHWRPELIRIGDEVTKDDAIALSRPIFDRCPVVAGVRRIKELEALRSHYVDLVVIWVNRVDHLIIADNTEVCPEHCDLAITAKNRSDLLKAARYMVTPIATILNRRILNRTGIR